MAFVLRTALILIIAFALRIIYHPTVQKVSRTLIARFLTPLLIIKACELELFNYIT